MIDVKQAIKIARDHMVEIYGAQALRNLQLEEVELTEDEKYWLVTYGFDTDREVHPLQAAVSIARARYVRDYKIVKLDAQNGQVKSLKIRSI